jgi:hypothetical protein
VPIEVFVTGSKEPLNKVRFSSEWFQFNRDDKSMGRALILAGHFTDNFACHGAPVSSSTNMRFHLGQPEKPGNGKSRPQPLLFGANDLAFEVQLRFGVLRFQPERDNLQLDVVIYLQRKCSVEVYPTRANVANHTHGFVNRVVAP